MPASRKTQPVCVYISDCMVNERCVVGKCVRELAEGEPCKPLEQSLGLVDNCSDGLRCMGPAGKTHCLAVCMPSERHLFGCPGNQECFPVETPFGVCGYRSTTGGIYPTRTKAIGESLGTRGILAVVAVCLLVLVLLAAIVVRFISKRKRAREEAAMSAMKQNPPPSYQQTRASFSDSVQQSARLSRPSHDIELPTSSSGSKRSPSSSSSDLYPPLKPSSAATAASEPLSGDSDFPSEDEPGASKASRFAPPPPSYTESSASQARAVAGNSTSKGGGRKARK